MIQLDGPQSGPSFWGSDPGFRTGVGLGVGLCLGSICLAVCQYSGVSEFVLRGKTAGQILTVDLRSLLSFSLCLMVRSADHQPNARSAQTGVADQLMGRSATHSPTARAAELPMHPQLRIKNSKLNNLSPILKIIYLYGILNYLRFTSMKKYLLFFPFLLMIFPVFSQNEILPRFPALNQNGSQLAFSWQGDIWVPDFESNRSTRLTVNESHEESPVWTRDGQRVIFTTNRFGIPDLMAIDVRKGNPQRLTYYSSSDTAPSVDASGNIYFTSSRAYKQLEREYEIMILPEGESTPYRFMDALGSEPVLSPDGRWMAFVRGNCRIVREQYRGPANRDIWLYEIARDRYVQITTDEGQDVNPQWTDDGKLYFLSARSGTYNVHSVELTSAGEPGTISAVTNFEDDGIRDYSIAGDGSRLV